MSDVYEFHGDPANGPLGWLGWRVQVSSDGEPTRCYGFDERDGVCSAAEAVQRVFTPEREGDRAHDGAMIAIEIEETRILVSAEISPN